MDSLYDRLVVEHVTSVHQTDGTTLVVTEYGYILRLDKDGNQMESYVYGSKVADSNATTNKADIYDNIKKVIFCNPATIVYWKDGDKTVVKANGEEFDREKGLSMAIIKKMFGNKGNFNNKFNSILRNAETLPNGRNSDKKER